MTETRNQNPQTVLILGDEPSYTVGIARPFLQSGAKVIVGHNHGVRAPMDSTGRIVALDFGDPEALTDELSALGPFQAAILTPRWFHRAFFLETTTESWDAALAINLEQAIYALQAVGRALVKQGTGGNVIVISSVAALRPHAELIEVGTALAALHVIARLLAVDLAKYQIRVNVLAAGWAENDWAAEYANPQTYARLNEVIPVGRPATMDEIGKMCRLLCSPDASYLTGAVIPLDGAYLIEKADGSPPPRI